MTGRGLGAYAAKRCAVRTQWDVVQPGPRLPAPEFIASLADAGIAFEAAVAARLVADGAVAVFPDRAAPELREAQTSDAMTQGVALIHGARLPVDRIGRRVAEPDLLVRVGDAPVDGRWRYRPVDIKHHAMLVDGTALPVVVWELAQLLDPTNAPPLDDEHTERLGRRDGSARDDLLQLAHYHRSLEACGHAAPGPAWGGVLGREQRVVFYELDRSRWQGGVDGRVSTLDSYDERFARRLAIADAAEAHLANPALPLLVEPVRISECPACPWRAHCDAILEERGDPSLLPRVGKREWLALREVGITSITALARLPDNVAVPELSDAVLDNLVSSARARLAPGPAYRRQGVRTVQVRRADVELDVDMENADEVYLWGVQVTDRGRTGLVDEGYLPFASWEPGLDTAGATDVFVRFWRWLSDLRRRCLQEGVSVAAYCWSGPAAENRWMKHYARPAGVLDEVTEYLRTKDWVDLEQPFKSRLVTGHGSSLKTVAPMTGFRWRDDDPGGGQSTLWYAQATDEQASEAARAASRQRILTYNEDDVLATLHVREWLTANAPFPSIRDLPPSD